MVSSTYLLLGFLSAIHSLILCPLPCQVRTNFRQGSFCPLVRDGSDEDPPCRRMAAQVSVSGRTWTLYLRSSSETNDGVRSGKKIVLHDRPPANFRRCGPMTAHEVSRSIFAFL